MSNYEIIHDDEGTTYNVKCVKSGLNDFFLNEIQAKRIAEEHVLATGHEVTITIKNTIRITKQFNYKKL